MKINITFGITNLTLSYPSFSDKTPLTFQYNNIDSVTQSSNGKYIEINFKNGLVHRMLYSDINIPTSASITALVTTLNNYVLYGDKPRSGSVQLTTGASQWIPFTLAFPLNYTSYTITFADATGGGFNLGGTYYNGFYVTNILYDGKINYTANFNN